MTRGKKGEAESDELNNGELHVKTVSDDCLLCMKTISKKGKVIECNKCDARCHQACAKAAGNFWCKMCYPAAIGDSNAAMCMLLQQLKDERDKSDAMVETIATLTCENKHLLSEVESLKAKIMKNSENSDNFHNPLIDGDDGNNNNNPEGEKGGKSAGPRRETYSQVANKTKQVITLKPKHDNDTAQAMMTLKTKLLKENKTLRVTKVSENHTKNTIDIHCNDDITRNEIKSKIAEGMTNVDVIEEQTICNHKCIKLFNIEEEQYEDGEDEFLDMIALKNGVDKTKHGFHMKILHYSQPNRYGGRNLIIQVDNVTYHEMMKSDKLYTLHRLSYFEQYVSVTVCKNCQAYGHIASKCTVRAKCSHCGGDHSFQQCNSEYRNCVNCTNYNTKINETDKKVFTNHAAYDRKCPSYIAAREKEIKKQEQ